MRKFMAFACFITVLSSCDTVPKEPDFVLSLKGDYKAIADCAYMTFRDLPNWRMTDLSSMHRVEFSFGNFESTAGRIHVEPDGVGQTKVTSYVQRAIWGKDFWANKYRPIFAACAS